MFLGEYQYSIDEKGRLTIPVKFRAPLLQGLVITRGLDRNLVIRPLDQWSDLIKQIENLPYSDPGARRLRRLIYSGACDLEPDRQGRINIPAYLLDYAKISREVVVAGVFTAIELWAPEHWDKVREELEGDGANEDWKRLGF